MCTALMKCVFFISCLMLCDSLKFSSLDKIYQKGVGAYSKERWSECIVQFEESLHLYKVYKGMIINCRLKCKSEHPKTEVEDIEELKIFEFFLNARNCVKECHRKGFENIYIYNNVSDTVLTYLQTKKPYAYLHICYFQMNDLPKAASAAYTYLIAHPDDNEMKNNVDYYVQQPEVDIKEVIDLESDNYQVLCKLGTQAYKQKKWGETINYMEEAITHYLAWENSCRAECDHLPEQDWSPEFTISISNNIASVLMCRQKCQEELKPFYASGVALLADTLNYLQICYYHTENIDNAAKTVATYLALLPNDEDMLENKSIYQTLTDEKKFMGRPDIIYYFKRDKYEKHLLGNFHTKNDSDFKTNSV